MSYSMSSTTLRRLIVISSSRVGDAAARRLDPELFLPSLSSTITRGAGTTPASMARTAVTLYEIAIRRRSVVDDIE